jgi:hypothetical protein
MPKIKYQEFNFRPATLALIKTANQIIAEYQRQGFDLTLRQLYYQFVSRDIIPNTLKSYKNLGSVINDARLAGMIDWETIVDRTRELRTLSHWNDPSNRSDRKCGSRRTRWLECSREYAGNWTCRCLAAVAIRVNPRCGSRHNG